MNFTESNTVEQMVLDALSSRSGGSGADLILREDPPGLGDSLGGISVRQVNLMQGGML